MLEGYDLGGNGWHGTLPGTVDRFLRFGRLTYETWVSIRPAASPTGGAVLVIVLEMTSADRQPIIIDEIARFAPKDAPACVRSAVKIGRHYGLSVRSPGPDEVWTVHRDADESERN